MKRDFASINRVMRKWPVGSQNPLLRSMHFVPEPAGASAATIELVEDPFDPEEAPEKTTERFNKLHAAARDLVKNKTATEGEIKKIGDQIAKFSKAFDKQAEKNAEAAQKAEEALSLVRQGLGSVPDAKMSGRSVEFLRNLSRGPKPDQELVQLVRSPVPIETSYFHLVSKPGPMVRSLGAPEEIDQLLARFRTLNDTIFVMNKLFSVRDSGTYQELGGMKGLALWKEWEEVCKRIRLADLAEGGSTTGGAWVPTIWSGNLINLVQILARCANYFETFPMQSLTHKQYVEGADTDAFFIAEGSSITQSDFTTFDATWVAAKLASRIITSREITQDSGVPFTQECERKLAKSQARGWEKVIVNGQKTGSSAGNPGSLDAGETMATNDARLLANGVRYWHAQTGLGVKDAGAGLTIESLAKLRGPMGAYGTEPSAMIWLCSAWGAAHMLTVRTEDGRPVLLSPRPDSQSPPGSVGRLLDSEIVLSSFVSDAMNSNGQIDGAGATTAIYYINTDQFKTGERLGIIVEASTHEKFSTDQIVFKSVRRVDFQPVRTPSASEPMVNAIGNLSLS